MSTHSTSAAPTVLNRLQASWAMCAESDRWPDSAAGTTSRRAAASDVFALLIAIPIKLHFCCHQRPEHHHPYSPHSWMNTNTRLDIHPRLLRAAWSGELFAFQLSLATTLTWSVTRAMTMVIERWRRHPVKVIQYIPSAPRSRDQGAEALFTKHGARSSTDRGPSFVQNDSLGAPFVKSHFYTYFSAKRDRQLRMCCAGGKPIGYPDSRTAIQDEVAGKPRKYSMGLPNSYKNPALSCTPILNPPRSLVTVLGLIGRAYTHDATI